MAGINRTTIIRGPALVQFGSVSFWSKGDVTLKPVNKRFTIATSHAGDVDERFSDRMLEVSFEPAGQFTDAIAAVLWPYGASAFGVSLFGATDDALVIWGREATNNKITIHNAALTGMPSIRMGVDKTTIGTVKFTGLLANSTDPTNAAAYYTIATAAYPGDAGFDIGEIYTAAGLAIWGGSAPWVEFRSQSGWEIDISMTADPVVVDGLGTVDMTLKDLKVSVKGTPMGVSVSDVMTALKTNQALGTSLSGDLMEVSDFITTHPRFYMPSAALVDADIGYGNGRNRIGQCEWIATRSGTDPLFEVTEVSV